MSKATTYDPAADHDPLFDLDPTTGGGTPMGEHAKATDKTVGTAWCPERNDTRKTGLHRQGQHVVWRIHDRVTAGGVRIQCRASGVPLCSTGHNGRDSEHPPSCSHP